MAQTRRDYWAKLIAEQEEAGETARAFCRGRGLSDQTFYIVIRPSICGGAGWRASPGPGSLW
jgi:hypothetical protein